MAQPSASKRADYDQPLKRLLTKAHDGLLDLLGQAYTWSEEFPTELFAGRRQTDLVWKVIDAAGQFVLLHIELQTHPDPAMNGRIAEYALLLYLRNGELIPTHSIVIYLQPAANLPTSPFEMIRDGKQVMRYDYDVVKLWELPQERVLATDNYDLWPLAVLMKDATLESSVAAVEQIAQKTELAAAERSELINLAEVFSTLRLGRGKLREALRGLKVIDDLLKESAYIQEALAEGEAKGKAEGKAEGELQATRTLTQLALEGRFGAPLSDDLVAALQAADVAPLREIIHDIATETLADARARLGLN